MKLTVLAVVGHGLFSITIPRETPKKTLAGSLYRHAGGEKQGRCGDVRLSQREGRRASDCIAGGDQYIANEVSLETITSFSNIGCGSILYPRTSPFRGDGDIGSMAKEESSRALSEIPQIANLSGIH